MIALVLQRTKEKKSVYRGPRLPENILRHRTTQRQLNEGEGEQEDSNYRASHHIFHS